MVGWGCLPGDPDMKVLVYVYIFAFSILKSCHSEHPEGRHPGYLEPESLTSGSRHVGDHFLVVNET